MSKNHFFEKKGPFPLKEILNNIGFNKDTSIDNNMKISGFEALNKAGSLDMTFLNSSKYKEISLKTNAAACITTSGLEKFLPEKCIKVNVKNVLYAVTKVSKMFYPKS